MTEIRVFVKEQLSNEANMILRVKKPDFLGDSMWDFVHAGRTFAAHMADAEWLELFRRGRVLLCPGDSLRVVIRSTLRYGFDNEVLGSHYDILKVEEVLHKAGSAPQMSLEE